MKERLLLIMFLLLVITLPSVTAFSCYQESANLSTVCVANNTGSYHLDGVWGSPYLGHLAYDGDYDTYAAIAAGNTSDNHIYINYTKPLYVSDDTLWQVKGGIGYNNITNFDSPEFHRAACWSYYGDTLVLRTNQDDPGTDRIRYECHNGSSWVTYLTQSNPIDGDHFYEEGIWWFGNLEFFVRATDYEGDSISLDVNNANLTVYGQTETSYDHSTTASVLGDVNATMKVTGYYESVTQELLSIVNASTKTFTGFTNAYLLFVGNKSGDVLNDEMTCSLSGSVINQKNDYYYAFPNGSSTIVCDSGSTYGTFNTTLTITGGLVLNQTVHVSEYSGQVWFYDAETDEYLTGREITLDLISDEFSNNYSTSNGNITFDYLPQGQVTLRYNSDGYDQNFHIFNVSSTQSEYYFNLSLLNSTNSDEVTITVYDTLGNELEGAIVKVQRYDPSTNTFSVVATGSTNFQGQTKLGLTLNDEYYKFLIEYGGVLRLTTQPTYVYGTTLSFYIDIGEAVLEDYYSSGAVSGRVSVNADKTLATFVWSDSEALATQGCLYGYKPVTGTLTLINSSCASTSSGTVYLLLNNVTSTTWFLSGKVLKEGSWYEIDTERVDYDVIIPDNNGFGLFLMFIILCVLVFIGYWNLEIAVLLGSAVPLLFTIIGLANIGYAIAIPVLIGGIIITFIMAVRK